MHQSSRLFRLSASVAVGALLCQAALPVALAQPAAPPQTQVVPPDQTQLDPPDRVGRIASETGAVSFRTSADTEWSAATANYPVSSGSAFWTEPSARAELEISGSRIDLSGQTELDVATLDDSGLQAAVPQGELYLHLIELAPNQEWSVQTPRGKVRLAQAGRYGIIAGTTEQPTQITVLEGAATLTGPGVSLTIAANQTATVQGDGPYQGTVGPEARDAFLAARLAAERPPATLPPPVSARLSSLPDIGDLAGSGEWGDVPDYGQVWYPPVAPGWIPYQNGQWAYVAPWGWTWIDSAAWGFVPFHYGRWAHFGHRWGWIPGDAHAAERQVYAPALVAFLGFTAGAAIGAGIAHGTIGWVPLGPGEAYHPWYRASEGYVRQINAGHVRDPASISAPVSMNAFVNRSGATEVPAAVMLGSRLVRPAAHPLSAATFATAHPVIGEQPLTPSAVTLGVTPAVARGLNLTTDVTPRAAPGPVVRAQRPGTASGPPALVGPTGGEPRPGEARVPEPGTERSPGGPLPLVVPGPRPLVVPGARPAGLPPAAREASPPGSPPAPGPGGPRSESRLPEGRPPGPPEIVHPAGAPPLQGPGARPPGVPEPHESGPREPPVVVPQPAPAAGQEPANRLPTVERPGREAPPSGRAPEVREAPPRVAEPHAPPPVEAPRIAPPPPHAEPPRAAPPPPRAEPPRAAPAPHVEMPRPAPPQQQRQPGER